MTIKLPKPRLLACLIGVIMAGPIGCANQQSMPFPNDPGTSNALPLNPESAFDGAVRSADSWVNLPVPPVPGAAAQAPATPPTGSDGWPRQAEIAGATALVYLPQVDSWQGNTLDFRAAVAVRKTGASEQAFGVIWGSARTGVDRLTTKRRTGRPQPEPGQLPDARRSRTRYPAPVAHATADGHGQHVTAAARRRTGGLRHRQTAAGAGQ